MILVANPKKIGSVLVILFLGGCSPLQFVSNYDEATDVAAQQIQKKIDKQITSMRSSSDEKLKFSDHLKFYEEITVDLTALEVRAYGIYKNRLTLSQIAAIKTNLGYMILLHKGCIDSPLSDDQRKLVLSSGPDLTLDCHVAYGAQSDSLGRGDIRFNRNLLPTIQTQFNQSFGAVMALELAKKRGFSANE